MRLLLFCALFISIALPAKTQEINHFNNPILRGDMPDPSVIRIDDTYYVTGTSSEWAPHYPVFTSKDLVNWEQIGHIFDKKPDWILNSFWAPELYVHNDKVYCYYTARKKSDNISCVGVAVADSPESEFVDYGPIIEFGKEAIDAFIFSDNGTLYISWKAYGLDQRPIEILASKLSDDGLRLEGEPFTLLVDEEKIGLEGQYHFKHDEYYYVIYAVRSCCGENSDYEVYVARAKEFKGPYERYENNPILYGGLKDYISCGHGTGVESIDGRLFFICHAYQNGSSYYMGRQAILQEMFITKDKWIEFKTGSLATIKQPIPFSDATVQFSDDFYDNFQNPNLKVDWTWNYPYTDIETTIHNNELTLSGTPFPSNKYGSALCLRAKYPNYSFHTKVSNTNDSFKGLTMYGDNNNLLLFGMQGSQLLIKKISGGEESLVYKKNITNGLPYLKIDVKDGCILTFQISDDGEEWETPYSDSVNCSQFPRWDRVARPGLIHIGQEQSPAKFSYFRLTNKLIK